MARLAEDDVDDNVGDRCSPHMGDVGRNTSARVFVVQVIRELVDDMLDARAVFDDALAAEHRCQSLAAGAVQCSGTGGSHCFRHIELVREELKLVDWLVGGIHHLIVGWIIDVEFVRIDAYNRTYVRQSLKKRPWI